MLTSIRLRRIHGEICSHCRPTKDQPYQRLRQSCERQSNIYEHLQIEDVKDEDDQSHAPAPMERDDCVQFHPGSDTSKFTDMVIADDELGKVLEVLISAHVSTIHHTSTTRTKKVSVCGISRPQSNHIGRKWAKARIRSWSLLL
jgi:hypothetical protein